MDRLVGLPERLPGHAALWWLAIFAAMVAVPTLILWTAGIQRPTVVDPRIWVAALLAAYSVAFINVLDGIARRAFREFEPALSPAVDRAGLERALTSVPDRVAFAAIVVVEIVITIGYFSDPGEASYIRALPPLGQLVILVPNWFSIAVTAVLLAHILRQLSTVTGMHRVAHIDLFDSTPAHAFARLTAATAVGILLFGFVVVADPSAARDSVLFVFEAAAILLLALAVFLLPLRGMHDRLARAQRSLMHAVDERIKITATRIHETVDRDDLGRSAALHESLSSLIEERELLSKLSTWPWSTGTLRGFASALVLPIVLWSIIRILERVF